MAKRAEFGVPMPESLKGRLVDDWENVTKNRQVKIEKPRYQNCIVLTTASYLDWLTPTASICI